MNPIVKAQWVAALKSGEYKQGKHKLRVADQFCCLGVLCNLHAQEYPEIAAMQLLPSQYMGENEWLPPSVQVWAGLVDRCGERVTIRGEERYLSFHNDSGRTFAEIAKAIEEQL